MVCANCYIVTTRSLPSQRYAATQQNTEDNWSLLIMKSSYIFVDPFKCFHNNK